MPRLPGGAGGRGGTEAATANPRLKLKPKEKAALLLLLLQGQIVAEREGKEHTGLRCGQHWECGAQASPRVQPRTHARTYAHTHPVLTW